MYVSRLAIYIDSLTYHIDRENLWMDDLYARSWWGYECFDCVDLHISTCYYRLFLLPPYDIFFASYRQVTSKLLLSVCGFWQSSFLPRTKLRSSQMGLLTLQRRHDHQHGPRWLPVVLLLSAALVAACCYVCWNQSFNSWGNNRWMLCWKP